MLRGEAALIAGIGLQSYEVQDGVAANKALQLGCAEQVDGWAATKHHEAFGKCLKLRMHAWRELTAAQQQPADVQVQLV